ncbi:hypothetical protein INT45_007504 [Circinella minor]|uniref:UDENN domain-containing protein n=1 Tax=Circinella minor TaxID=1195481 RepID=A0A8H7SFI2_9FUNG|nr:hypothetical protein INT45_007504 [Circinella minor]
MDCDLSNLQISSPMQSILSDDDEDDLTMGSGKPAARPWSYASNNLRSSLAPPSTSPAVARRAMARYQEADIGDTPRLYSIRKQPSSQSFLNTSMLEKSSSEPNLLDELAAPPHRFSSPAPPPSQQLTVNNKASSIRINNNNSSSESINSDAVDVDITENSAKDAMLKMEPEELQLFRRWVIGFCVVNFDLEIGQALDYVYPPMELTVNEKKNICFSAFPDSNVFEVGDQVYNIRVRASTVGLAVSGPTTSAGFLYGYVFFRQKKDPRIRRGYFQKSLVLLSQHPYVGLFSRMVAILGPSFFDTGQPMLEAACMNIAHWGPVIEGKVLDLPFLGQLLEVEISRPYEPQLLETTSFDMGKLQPEMQIMASLPVGGLYHHFKDILQDLWLLWELMLLAEPLVVIAPDPGVCSEAVVSLVDLINPIPYCGDYRPYFTIQDTDFKSFVTKSKPPTNLILGVTNPFFNTAIEHWPHVVRVGRQQLRKPDGTLIPAHSNHVRAHKPKTGLGAKSNILFEFVQGVTSKRKGIIAKDRQLLKMLTEASMRGHPPDWVLNNMLRRHFVDLTGKFLVPLDRYFSTLIPAPIQFQTDSGPPQLRPFQTEQFMKSLKDHQRQLPFKSTFKTRTTSADPMRDLYAQFLKCGNFATWLQHRTTEAQSEIMNYYIQKLCEEADSRSSADLKSRIRDVLYPPSSSTYSNFSVNDKQREQLMHALGERN